MKHGKAIGYSCNEMIVFYEIPDGLYALVTVSEDFDHVEFWSEWYHLVKWTGIYADGNIPSRLSEITDKIIDRYELTEKDKAIIADLKETISDDKHDGKKIYEFMQKKQDDAIAWCKANPRPEEEINEKQ